MSYGIGGSTKRCVVTKTRSLSEVSFSPRRHSGTGVVTSTCNRVSNSRTCLVYPPDYHLSDRGKLDPVDRRGRGPVTSRTKRPEFLNLVLNVVVKRTKGRTSTVWHPEKSEVLVIYSVKDTIQK